MSRRAILCAIAGSGCAGQSYFHGIPNVGAKADNVPLWKEWGVGALMPWVDGLYLVTCNSHRKTTGARLGLYRIDDHLKPERSSMASKEMVTRTARWVPMPGNVLRHCCLAPVGLPGSIPATPVDPQRIWRIGRRSRHTSHFRLEWKEGLRRSQPDVLLCLTRAVVLSPGIHDFLFRPYRGPAAGQLRGTRNQHRAADHPIRSQHRQCPDDQ